MRLQVVGLALAASVAGLSLYGKATASIIRRRVDEALNNPPMFPKYSDSLVSIVIPALREEAYLPDLLTTIQNQTYSPIEIVVADSSEPPWDEQTQQVCQQFGAKYTYIPKGNISQARNWGAINAQGDILMFIDADCWLTDDYVERLVNDLKQGYVFAHGADPRVDTPFDFVYILGSMLFKPKTYTARGLTIWRDAFWQIGGFDESYDPKFPVNKREDLKLGRDVREMFGVDLMYLDRHAVLATSSRRDEMTGHFKGKWVARGIRNGELVDGMEDAL